jgi:hypothetical protein
MWRFERSRRALLSPSELGPAMPKDKDENANDYM